MDETFDMWTSAKSPYERRTYDGRALAVVRLIGPGKIRLLATAPECDPAEIVITVEPVS
ncbi:hypothetical protein [Nonomuraea sp. NPDC049400]|uniref:hypothetical protein n=1 Tax=Nonomuraea sp. NPDC049400 TaxID=3364352 RepID=UPI00379A0A59